MTGTERYWEERFRDSFGLESAGYIGLGPQYNRWLYRVRRHVFLNSIAELGLKTSNLSVLDIGSGSGFYVGCWKELKVKKISGLDFTKIAIDRLSNKYDDSYFYHLDIGEDIPFHIKEKFDAVSAFDVMFHILNDSKFEKAIHNISKLLRKNAYFFWSDNLHEKAAIISKTQVNRNIRYVRDILYQHNLPILWIRPMFNIMNAPIVEVSNIRKALWYLLQKSIKWNRHIGSIWGAFLYPMERLFLSLSEKAFSTQYIVCKKNSD